jgi:hypothetical protein
MARLTTHKTSFTAGEISPRLLGRGDLRAYENGAARLRNVFVHPTGGISRRSGLRFVDTARGAGRLVAFEFNTEQVYLLVFTDTHIDVYKDGVNVADFSTPWTASQVLGIVWVQSADTLLVVHPDHPPKKITRTSDTNWTVNDWVFVTDDSGNRIQQPHHKFADDDVTLQPSATTGTVTLTASADVFVADHVGVRFRLQNKEVEVSSFTSATQVQALVKETLASTAASKDWEEQAFSSVRGWLTTVCFHQDRMVIGGSRDLPNRLWLSKSADLYNFDLGEGLDDEGIEFALLSDHVNAIRAVFSGRHLQIFTSGAEWMATGDPLTPTNIQLNRQTRIGSSVDRYVPPRDVDGATLFIPRDGGSLREFLFADIEQAYQAKDLATVAEHLINGAVDQDYDTAGRLLHIVMSNGSLGTVTMFRAEEVTAWTLQETDGSFLSVCVVGEDTYLLIQRGVDFQIERFDEGLNVDSGLTGSDVAAKAVWSGLGHLEGRQVRVLGDGSDFGTHSVVTGAVTLAESVSAVQIGLPFNHTVEALPPAIQTNQGGAQGGKLRPVAITLRLKDTVALHLDTGKGLREVPFKRFGGTLLDASPEPFTGDKTVRAFGWKADGTISLWRIEQDTPLPFTLLSVATELSVNG